MKINISTYISKNYKEVHNAYIYGFLCTCTGIKHLEYYRYIAVYINRESHDLDLGSITSKEVVIQFVHVQTQILPKHVITSTTVKWHYSETDRKKMCP